MNLVRFPVSMSASASRSSASSIQRQNLSSLSLMHPQLNLWDVSWHMLGGNGLMSLISEVEIWLKRVVEIDVVC